MAFKYAERVQESSTSTGTGDLVLGGVPDSTYQAFSAAFSNGDTTDVAIFGAGGFESCRATYNTGANSITRGAIYASSNAGAAVNFAAGTKTIICSAPGSIIQSVVNGGSGCGKLKYVSATQINFEPRNGDRVKINGSWYLIPAAGVTAANTSVYVNGTAGQNLAASTVYLVTLFNSSGTPTVDYISGASAAVPGTHAPDAATAGNIGVEIKTQGGADPTRSVIGMIRTNASSQFVDTSIARFVVSWFNRENLSLEGAYTVGSTTTSASFVELATSSRIEGITWGPEGIPMAISGQATNSSNTGSVRFCIGIDSAASVVAIDAYCNIYTVNTYLYAALAITKTLSEGYHYATPIAKIDSGGTGVYYLFVVAILRG